MIATLAIPGLLLVAADRTDATSAETPTASAPAQTPPPEDPTIAATPQPATVDDLPNPQEEKRRELRRPPCSRSSTVRPRSSSAGAARSSTSALPRPRTRPGAAEPEDQYVELSRETTDKIFVILAEFGNVRHPSYPDQDTNPQHPGPARFDGPLHNADPRARPRRRQLARTGRPTTRPSTTSELYFGRRRRRVAEDVLRAAVVGSLQRRRHGHRLGQGAGTTRPATAAATASRAPATCAATRGS